MTDTNTPRGLDEYAVRLVRCRARQVSSKAGFTASDRDDLEQDLVLDLLLRLPQFDGARARREVFIGRVVRNRVATLLEARRTAKRGGRCGHVSLQDEIDDGEGRRVELGLTLDETDARRRTGAQADIDAGLHIDVRDAVAALPDGLRLLATALMVATPSEVSRATGVPRNTIHDAMRRIRAHFREAGLPAYLPPPVMSPTVPVRLQGGLAVAHGRAS